MDEIKRKTRQLAGGLKLNKSGEELEKFIREEVAIYLDEYWFNHQLYHEGVLGYRNDLWGKFREWLAMKIWPEGGSVMSFHGYSKAVRGMAGELGILGKINEMEIEVLGWVSSRAKKEK